MLLDHRTLSPSQRFRRGCRAFSDVNVLLRIILLLFACLAAFLLLRTPTLNYVMKENRLVRETFEQWHNCIHNNISSFYNNPEGMWGNFWRGVRLCEALPQIKQIVMTPLQNSDETKYHVMSPDLDCVMVTLGIGHDTRAEEALLKQRLCRFYGADPITEINEALFVKFGKFFPFAVGADMGTSTAQILNKNGGYEPRTVVHIDVISFLQNFVKESFIDDIWVDAEGAEYGMLPMFHDGGKFDQNGITFCQFNMEIHKPDMEQKAQFAQFITRILQDKRYAFFRIIQGSHIRLFFINFREQRCVQKYLMQFFNGSTLPSQQSPQ